MAVQEGEAANPRLSLRISIASEEDHGIYCQQCDKDGPRLSAHGYCTDCKEHLCRACVISHKNHEHSKHHTLLHEKRMPSYLQLPAQSTQTRQSDDVTTLCHKHSNEMIKFYCSDHKKLLCNICIALEHTNTSCTVNYIPDISAHFINSEEYKAKLKELDVVTAKYKEIIKELEEMTRTSNISLTESLEGIKKFREEINQRLDEMERQLKDEVQKIQEENENHVRTVETTHTELINTLSSCSYSTRKLNTTLQASKLFVAIKLAEEKIAESQTIIHHLQSIAVRNYNFKPNDALFKFIEKEKSIGTLVQKTASKISPGLFFLMKPRNILYSGQVYVKISQDVHRCQIAGMDLLTPDIIVLTDQGNKAIKIIDVSRSLLMDYLLLDSTPRDVTSVTNARLAVTLPTQNKIQLVSIFSNGLRKTRAIKVDGACHGISYYQEKLIVSFYNPAKLEILDMNGVILSNFVNIFENPLHVSANGSSIYVSDWGMKSVMRLSWKGEVLGCYGGMDFPCGLVLSDDGTIFVCDNERCVIEEIAEDFSARKVVLKDIESPYSVCWCAKTNKLYCCTLNDINNVLNIYKQV